MDRISNPTPPFFIGLSNLYLILTNTLLSKLGLYDGPLKFDIPEDTKIVLNGFMEAVENAGRDDVANLRSSLCRKDLDRSTRLLWEDTLKQFYSRYGYRFEEGVLNADHLIVKFAFISYILRDSADALSMGDKEKFRERLVVLHRFINVHILPMIRDCDSAIIKSIRPIISFTLSLLRDIVIGESY